LRPRRLTHQPGELDRAFARLDHVHGRRRDHVVDDHADLLALAVRPSQRLGEFRQLVDLPERLGIEHAVGVLVVDDPDDDHIVQTHRPLHPVVEHADGLLGREHVLRIRVDADRVQERKLLRPDRR